MYELPNLVPEKVSELNSDVTIANLERNNIQIGTVKAPALVHRVSLPYGKIVDETRSDDDYGLTIDLCDVLQIRFFEQLEEAVANQCKETFGDTVPMKPLTIDGFSKLKIKKFTDVTTMSKKKLTISDLGSQDKVVLIIRVSCLWKSQAAMGASLRVIRVLQLEKGVPESLPDFMLDEE